MRPPVGTIEKVLALVVSCERTGTTSNVCSHTVVTHGSPEQEMLPWATSGREAMSELITVAITGKAWQRIRERRCVVIGAYVGLAAEWGAPRRPVLVPSPRRA